MKRRSDSNQVSITHFFSGSAAKKARTEKDEKVSTPFSVLVRYADYPLNNLFFSTDHLGLNGLYFSSSGGVC